MRGRREASAPRSSSDADVEQRDDAAIDAAWDELQAKRAAWEADVLHDESAFYTHIEGRKSAVVAVGAPWVNMMMKARAGLPAFFFCALYGLQKTHQFSLSDHGEHDASMLAVEVAKRYQYLYGMWLESGDETYKFSSFEIEGLS